MVGEFRERALSNGERELENTVLLLTRHFDQQLEDSESIATNLISQMDVSGIASPEIFRSEMSDLDAHLMLKSKVSVLSYIGDVNIYDCRGRTDQFIRDPGRCRPSTLPTGPISRSSNRTRNRRRSWPNRFAAILPGSWTTVIAHRLSGPNGVFLGVMARRIDPANFEKFFASRARSATGAAISMFHRDGTMLARYPHADSMIGQEIQGRLRCCTRC